jgi:hypothetical protein
MKGVFKENKDLVFLKEEFTTFVKKKKQTKSDIAEKVSNPKKETLLLEEVEL